MLLARGLDDGSTLVRSIVFDVGRASRWHFELTAIGATSRRVLEFDDMAGKRGNVRTRVVLTGPDEPRLRMSATRRNGGRCLIGLDPPNAATDAPLKVKGLDAAR